MARITLVGVSDVNAVYVSTLEALAEYARCAEGCINEVDETKCDCGYAEAWAAVHLDL